MHLFFTFAALNPHRVSLRNLLAIGLAVIACGAIPARAMLVPDPLLVAQSDLDGDAVRDDVRIVYDDQPGSLPSIQIALSGETPPVTIASPQSSSFAFDVTVADFDGSGPTLPLLVVAEPRYVRSGVQTGRVWLFDPRTGAEVRSFDSPGSPSTTRIGLRSQAVRDQNGDGLMDVLTEGATRVEGVWSPTTFLFSGRDGRLLASMPQSFERVTSVIDSGTRIFSASDVVADGVIDVLDLGWIASRIGTSVQAYHAGDLNGDGLISAEDLLIATDEFISGARIMGFLDSPSSSSSFIEFDRVWSQAFGETPGSPAADRAAVDTVDHPGDEPSFGPQGDGQSNSLDNGGGQESLSESGQVRPYIPIPGMSTCGEDLSLDCGLGSPPIFDPFSANLGWCDLQPTGCPSHPVQIGDFISLGFTGTILGNPKANCRDEYSLDGVNWYPITDLDDDESGRPIYRVPNQTGFLVLANGCITVRKFCELEYNDPMSPARGCCACAQCTICAEPPPSECTGGEVHLFPCESSRETIVGDPDPVLNCDPENQELCTVYRSSCDPVTLTAEAVVSGGVFSWYVNSFVTPELATLANPSKVTLTPEEIVTPCHIVNVRYCLLNEAGVQTQCCTNRYVRIITNDIDCDDLDNDDEVTRGTDPENPDSDGDGFCDGLEVHSGTDPLGFQSRPMIVGGDIDRDGLYNWTEHGKSSSGFPTSSGTVFGRAAAPGPIAVLYDTDLDGVQDLAEIELGLNPSEYYIPPTPESQDSIWSSVGGIRISRTADRFLPASLAADLDQDLVYDEYEREHGFDPTNADIDGDGIRDGIELRSGTDPRINHRFESADTDGDGLCDYEEVTFYATSPTVADTDKDGLPDGFEVRAGLNPLNLYTYQIQIPIGLRGSSMQFSTQRVHDALADMDEDGLGNYYEYMYGSDPLGPDTDGDGVKDGTEVDQGTSPRDPTDGESPPTADGLCVLRITVGGHTHALGCWGSEVDPTRGTIGYDPIHNPGTDESDKRDHHWTVTIGGGGDTGGGNFNGGFPINLSTTADGRWGQIDIVVPKGVCLPMQLSYGGIANGAPLQFPPHLSLHVIPVNGRGGALCEDCCCLIFDHGDEEYDGTTLGAPPLFGSSCQVDPETLTDRVGHVCAALVDLDIDSDNNSKLELPQESLAEDSVEESIPGKVITVHDDDSDTDGIPDWADGFKFTTASLGLGTPGSPDQIAEPGDQKFVPIVVKYGGLGGEPENYRVTFDYPASDPALVTTDEITETIEAAIGISESRTRRTFSLPEGSDQRFRLWTKNGNVIRDAESVASDGDFVPTDTELDVAKLDPGNTGRIVLYLEAVRPTLGDTPDFIGVTFSGTGDSGSSEACPDKVAVSATLIQYVEVRPLASGTQYKTVSRPSLARPAPTVSMDWQTVDDPRFDETYTQIVADIKVNATVNDFASDLIPTSDGVISTAPLVLNGEYLRASPTDPPLAVEFDVGKELERTTDPVHPYPFGGTTPGGQVFSNVVLQPGWNQLRLLATNRHGFTGFSESAISFDVETPDVSIDVELDVGANNPYKPANGIVGTLAVTVTRTFANGSVVTNFPATQVTSSDSEWVVSGSIPAGDLESIKVDSLSTGLLTFYPKGRTAPGIEIPVDLVQSTSGKWNGSGFLADYDQENYLFSRVTEGEHGDPRSYDGGDNLGFMVEFVGPNYLKRPEDAIALLGRDYKYTDYTVNGQSRTFLMNETVAALPDEEHRTPSVFIGMPNLAKVANDPFRSVVNYYEKVFTTDYMHGFAVGLWEGGVVSIWDGGVDLYQSSVGLTTWIIEHSLAGAAIKWWEGNTLREIAEDERQYWAGACDDAGRLALLMAKLKANDVLVTQAIITGDTSMLDEELRTIVETARTIIDTAVGYMDNISPRELGELHGNVTGQLVQIIALEALTAGGATPALISKSSLLTKFVTKLDEPIELAPKLERLRELLSVRQAEFVTKVVASAEELATTQMCFVAGTLVWTVTGLTPIESLCRGDLVLARDENTNDQAYGPVVDTIVTYPSELWTASVSRSSGGPSPSDERLVGTAEHPFWVNEHAAFVPMSRLCIGDTLSLASGDTATVTDIVVEQGFPHGRSPIVTYNIEVAGFHTYFVGEHGVWVHNAGNECERIRSVFKRLLDKESPGNPMQAYLRTRESLPNMTEGVEAGVVKEALDEIVRLNDSNELIPRWKSLGIDDETGLFREREVFAGYRFEAKTGRTLRRPSFGESGDFVDNLGNQWDVKGPYPAQADFDGPHTGVFASLKRHIVDHPNGDEKLLVDIAGLTDRQKQRVISLLEDRYPQHHYILNGRP